MQYDAAPLPHDPKTTGILWKKAIESTRTNIEEAQVFCRQLEVSKNSVARQAF